MDMIILWKGIPLDKCTNGEIVNALRAYKDGIIPPDNGLNGGLLKEAVKRELLPDAMWLVT